MGSSFTIVNNTPTIVYASSSISWGAVGIVLAAVGAALVVILSILSGGLATVALVDGYSKAVYAVLLPILGISGSSLITITIITWAGSVIVMGGGGLTLMITGAIMGPVGEAASRAEIDNIRNAAKDAVEGFTRLAPGHAYKFSGTLSLVRDCTVIYDDGSATRQNCWTAKWNKQNNEYKVLDKMFTTSTFVGCWRDATKDHPKAHKGTDGVTRTFTNRIMGRKTSGTVWYKETCMERCSGYEFYGLQYPQMGWSECWCSNNMWLVDEGEMVKRAIDPKNCGGSRNGGAWAMAVYKITPSKQYMNLYNWKHQQNLANNFKRRRMELGQSIPELGHLMGEENHEGIELIEDFHAYRDAGGLQSLLTSEELAMDHRRLSEDKQKVIFVEELEPEPHRRLNNRLFDGSMFVSHDHDQTALRLTSWVEMSDETTFPTLETCQSDEMEECSRCVECISCLEDQTGAICASRQCLYCDRCAEYPICLAIEEGCAEPSEMDNAMEACAPGSDPASCTGLNKIMKCVSESVW